MDELYNKKNYFNPYYKYILNKYIREYDMRKSNISILYDKGIITLDDYVKLNNAPRQFRQVYIGKLILSNPKIQEILDKGVLEYKEKLFKANNIKEYQVLTIKNDAVFIIDKKLETTKFSNTIEFIPKNTYTSFYLLGNKNKKELYYYFNNMNYKEVLDVKGINDNMLFLHEDYLIEFFKVLFCTAQTESIKECIELLTSFIDQYRRLELDVEYYRRFDSDCMYDLMPTKVLGSYKVPFIMDYQKYAININHNLKLLLDLNKIFSDIYLTQNRM